MEQPSNLTALPSMEKQIDVEHIVQSDFDFPQDTDSNMIQRPRGYLLGCAEVLL